MANTINISLSIQISNAVIIACITIGTSYTQKLSIDSYMSLILLINEFIIEFVFCKYKNICFNNKIYYGNSSKNYEFSK